MFKRTLRLLLLALWAPAALAFPPCPQEPVDLEPIDGGTGASTTLSTTPMWFKGWYALVGDPDIIGVIAPLDGSGRQPSTGKCRDRDTLPVPAVNNDSGSFSLTPVYAPKSGFGIVALPDLRDVTGDIDVSYTLGFAIDNTRLAKDQDWFDVAQLQFHWQHAAVGKPGNAVSATYRVRKHQPGKGSARIEVIEAREFFDSGDYTRPPVSLQVIASIPMDPAQASTPIELRWHQSKTGDGSDGGEIGLPPPEQTESLTTDSVTAFMGPNIDSMLEVVGPDGRVLYSIKLNGQWAGELTMGLLNYNVEKAEHYAERPGVVIEKMQLQAQ